MKIEIVEYYPLKDKRVPYDTGTLHVYLCDFDVDIRGIGVMFFNGKWYINMPFFTGYCEERKIAVRYPIFNLTSPQKHKKLVEGIKEEAIKYITDNYINKDKPILSSFKPYAPEQVKAAKKEYIDMPKKSFNTNQQGRKK